MSTTPEPAERDYEYGAAALNAQIVAEAELEKARATVLRERADFFDGVLRDSLDQDSDPRYCTAIHDVALGLRRLAAETAAGSGGQAEAHPAETSWRVETYDDTAEQWAPGTLHANRATVVDRLAFLKATRPTWAVDGKPVERRLVRATTTYTVETGGQAEDGAAWDRAVAEAEAAGVVFGAPDCSCTPFTLQNGERRYCGPDDTVDQVSGWERSPDCPYHAPITEDGAQQK